MDTVQLGKGWFPEESGGLNRYYLDLVRHLPQIGVGVSGLVAGSDDVTTDSAGAVRPFAPRAASLAWRLSAVRAHARRALAERPQSLFVAHFALYAAPCLGLLKDQPMVIHFHGPWAGESRAEGEGRVAIGFKHWVEHSVYCRATRLIVLSRAFGRVLEEEHGVPGDRIRVIPGGVDTRRFAPAVGKAGARVLLGWPTDRPIALVVRRLVRRMGLEELIASIRIARAALPDLLLLIAGRGPLAHELEAKVRAESLEQNVQLLGFLPDQDLPLAYRAADLSIVPSVALEGFGLIVPESLAAGTPVLVTAVGGLPETVEGLSSECVIRGRGPKALGQAIAEALLGSLPMPSPEECQSYAERRFDWAHVRDQVRGAYQEVLA